MSGSENGRQRTDQERIEGRVLALGEQILRAAWEGGGVRTTADRWLNGLLQRSMADELFRVQALRFIDALPALTDDADLLRHFNEYFADQEMPLPGVLQWGCKHLARGVAPAVLAPVIRRTATILARRYLGGEGIDQVQETLKTLRGRGLGVSLDRLGEAVVSEAEADAYLQRYLEIIDALANLEPPGQGHQGPNLSVKVSSLYSRISARAPEASVAGILARLRPLLRKARSQGISVCLDMEQYDFKHVTLAVFHSLLRDAEFQDWDGLGIALQSYLCDSESDLEELLRLAGERNAAFTVRLVRGAYWDQEMVLAEREGWAAPVWASKPETDRAFERCLARLFAAHGEVRTAVATHNVRSLALALALAEAYRLETEAFEFQMLYGMGTELQTALAGLGHPLRIYLPFGKLLPGMAYLVRRLLENSSSQSFLSLGSVPAGDPATLLAPPQPEPTESQPQPLAEQPVRAFSNTAQRRFTSEQERQAFLQALERVRGRLGQDYPLIIGGQPQETGEWIPSIDPALPKRLVGRVAAAGVEQAEAALRSARDAFRQWSQAEPGVGSALLRRVAGLLREQRDEFAAWEVFEAGKGWSEADADVAEAIDFLGYYADDADRLAEGMCMDVAGETNRYLYRPRGVGLILAPWNFPLAILVGMLSAAVVTGNTVIVKPSSQTPVVAARFMGLLQQAGIPDGVVNLLPGAGSVVGEHLVRHPELQFVCFTGSREVGTRINRLAAEILPGQTHVKRVIAEMGGKNAVIVDGGADLDDAVRGIIASAYGYQGQKCSACSRVILVESAYRTLLPRLIEAAASLRIGPPEDPATDMGPVIEASAQERILGVIEQGKRLATLELAPEVGSAEAGFFVGPALFSDVPPDSSLAQEEIFGPVLSVIRARDFDHALKLANATRYALTGGVYSRSPAHLLQARREFQVGNLYLNRGITGARVGRQPFGGFRMSGVGSKAGGPDYLLQFMEPRTHTENTLRRGYAPTLDAVRSLSDGSKA